MTQIIEKKLKIFKIIFNKLKINKIYITEKIGYNTEKILSKKKRI